MPKAKKFNKIDYFAFIRKMIADLKKSHKLDYIRMFSDKRKSTNYRTKLWGVGAGRFYGIGNPPSKNKSIVRRINKKYGKKVQAAYQPKFQWSPSSIIITPKQ
jgi:hypothetical protein